MDKVELNLKGKRVLVTGGAGFAGSHLVEELIAEGAIVTAIDIVKPKSGYYCCRRLDEQSQFIFGDINDADVVLDVLSKYQIQIIFHLAAQPIVEVALANPRRTLETNILGTVNMLEGARILGGIEAVIVASSDKAYGKLESGMYSEDFPLKGDHPYDVSKSAADLISQTYFRTYGLPVVVTRFGNIYGEGDPNYTRLVPSIVESIISGDKLHLRSDGKATRELLYVKDVARGYIGLAKNIATIKGEAFNFASSDAYTVVELIEHISSVTGKKIPYIIDNTAQNEIPFQRLDSSKVKNAIGWSAQHTIASTIGQIIEYHKEVK